MPVILMTRTKRFTTGYIFTLEGFVGSLRFNLLLHCPQRRQNIWLLSMLLTAEKALWLTGLIKELVLSKVELDCIVIVKVLCTW